MAKPIGALAALSLMIAGAAGAAQPTIEGFVDASYVYDLNAERGEFGLDQVEVDVLHAVSERTSVRADLEWVKDGDDYAVAVEQGYLTWAAGLWSFSFGRFNAPIGFEMMDAPEMYQFSHALVYDTLPGNLTGLMVARPLVGCLSAQAYLVNGWDQNAESNRLLTGGGRLAFDRGLFSGGVSFIAGREESGEAVEFDRSVLDLDLTVRPAGWLLGAEVTSGVVEPVGGERGQWLGFMVMAHRDFNAWSGLTVRVDHLDDQDGVQYGLFGDESQVRQAFAVAPTFVLDEGVGALIELRVDKCDQEVFVDPEGEATDSQMTLAIEATYSW